MRRHRKTSPRVLVLGVFGAILATYGLGQLWLQRPVGASGPQEAGLVPSPVLESVLEPRLEAAGGVSLELAPPPAQR